MFQSRYRTAETHQRESKRAQLYSGASAGSATKKAFRQQILWRVDLVKSFHPPHRVAENAR